MNYKKAYLELFNDITEIIEKLKQSQLQAEENCISSEDKIKILNNDKSFNKNDTN